MAPATLAPGDPSVWHSQAPIHNTIKNNKSLKTTTKTTKRNQDLQQRFVLVIVVSGLAFPLSVHSKDDRDPKISTQYHESYTKNKLKKQNRTTPPKQYLQNVLAKHLKSGTHL